MNGVRADVFDYGASVQRLGYLPQRKMKSEGAVYRKLGYANWNTALQELDIEVKQSVDFEATLNAWDDTDCSARFHKMHPNRIPRSLFRKSFLFEGEHACGNFRNSPT